MTIESLLRAHTDRRHVDPDDGDSTSLSISDEHPDDRRLRHLAEQLAGQRPDLNVKICFDHDTTGAASIIVATLRDADDAEAAADVAFGDFSDLAPEPAHGTHDDEGSALRFLYGVRRRDDHRRVVGSVFPTMEAAMAHVAAQDDPGMFDINRLDATDPYAVALAAAQRDQADVDPMTDAQRIAGVVRIGTVVRDLERELERLAHAIIHPLGMSEEAIETRRPWSDAITHLTDFRSVWVEILDQLGAQHCAEDAA